MLMNETEKIKQVASNNYNYHFDKVSGKFARWGKSYSDNPEFAPAPEILDIEVTTICNHGCAFCYKSNTQSGRNMSFKMFKTIIDKFPKMLTQIAFGADASATSNSELFKMMWYAREKGFIPNITVADISETTANKLSSICGAVAVSRYKDSEVCYNSIKLLKDAGLDQVNIHILVSLETLGWIYETFEDYLNGKIPGLNAIVLLGLKQKGRGEHFNRLDQKSYDSIINFALKYNIPIGADSCSGPKLINAVKERDDFKQIYDMVDPCESTLFSWYVDVDGYGYPCSFTPGTNGWKHGINMLKVDNFTNDVWNNIRTINFRQGLILNKDHNNCRQCPIYTI